MGREKPLEESRVQQGYTETFKTFMQTIKERRLRDSLLCITPQFLDQPFMVKLGYGSIRQQLAGCNVTT